jgi:hypothetical protein
MSHQTCMQAVMLWIAASVPATPCDAPYKPRDRFPLTVRALPAAGVEFNWRYLRHGICESTATCLTPDGMADNYGIYNYSE